MFFLDVFSDFVIMINFVIDLDMYNFEFVGDIGVMDWSFLVDGVMWSVSIEVGYFGYVIYYCVDNFYYLGINIGFYIINNYLILESLEFQFFCFIVLIGM